MYSDSLRVCLLFFARYTAEDLLVLASKVSLEIQILFSMDGFREGTYPGLFFRLPGLVYQCNNR